YAMSAAVRDQGQALNGGQHARLGAELLGVSADAEAPPLWEEIWLRPAKLAGPLAARLPGFRPGLRSVLAFEIDRHGSADEFLQGRLIDLVAFVDVDRAPDISLEAVFEQT